MYQWVEEEIEDHVGVQKDKVYKYNKEWKQEIINSNEFDNKSFVNPNKMPCIS